MINALDNLDITRKKLTIADDFKYNWLPQQKKNIKRILGGVALAGGLTAVALGLSGCSKEKPKEFETVDIYGAHLESARLFAERYGGSKGVGYNLDLDGDSMGDNYIIFKDGTIYYTSSKRLIQGQDNDTKRMWYMVEPTDTAIKNLFGKQ